MATPNKGNGGFSQEEIFEQLRKIQEEEDKLYGRQTAMQFEQLDAKGKTAGEEFDADEESLINDSEDPALCKKMFYRIQSLMNSKIKNKRLRDFANNEKRLYLKSSSQSGDTRFSFKNNLSRIEEIVVQWSRTDANGFDLGMQFYELNEREGFHKDDNIKQANLFS